MTFKDRPGSEPDVAYAYDNRGLQLSATFPSTGESVASAWDGFGRIVSSRTTRGGFAVVYAYQYDADGNRIGITHPDDPAFAYDRDGLGRVSAIRHGGSTLIVLAYDASRLVDNSLYAWTGHGSDSTSSSFDGPTGTARAAAAARRRLRSRPEINLRKRDRFSR